MGRTPTPLLIWVADQWGRHPKVVELAAKGHNIVTLSASVLRLEGERGQPDLILAPEAHYWSDNMWPYLDAALKRARARRKTVKAREEKV